MFTCPVNSVHRVTSTLNPIVPSSQNKTAYFFLSTIIFLEGEAGDRKGVFMYQVGIKLAMLKMILNF